MKRYRRIFLQLVCVSAAVWFGFPCKVQAIGPTLPPVNLNMSKEGICKGSVPSSVKLKKIGATIAVLKKGLSCLRGDFDGNGTADYLIWQATGSVNARVPGGWRAMVLFMLDNKLMSAVPLEHEFLNLPALYKKLPDKKTAKQFKDLGCPPADKTDGIIEWGEGDASHIFFWVSSKQVFREATCASELE